MFQRTNSIPKISIEKLNRNLSFTTAEFNSNTKNIIIAGPISPYAKHRRIIRHENASKRRDLEERSSDARARREGHYGLCRSLSPQPVDRQTILLVPRRRKLVFDHGIRARWRHDGAVD